MKALSIRQPWAWLIVNGWKDVENRTWWCGYRGPLLIHASKGMTRNEYADCFWYVDGLSLPPPVVIPAFDDLIRGAVVGSVVMVGCVSHSTSPWFEGPYGFELTEPKAFAPQEVWPARGSLGIFDLARE